MNTTIRQGPYIQTYMGVRFYPLEPRPGDILIEDIAHALSNICRFTGHTRQFYSVAQHSVLVSQYVAPEHALAALLHDASEAYLCDIAKPIKMLSALDEYNQIEELIMQAIAAKFGFAYPLHESIKQADAQMLFTEKRDLMQPLNWGYQIDPYPDPIYAYHPTAAKDVFLSRYKTLIRS